MHLCNCAICWLHNFKINEFDFSAYVQIYIFFKSINVSYFKRMLFDTSMISFNEKIHENCVPNETVTANFQCDMWLSNNKKYHAYDIFLKKKQKNEAIRVVFERS